METIKCVRCFDGMLFPEDQEERALRHEIDCLCEEGVEIWDSAFGRYPWDSADGVENAVKSDFCFLHLVEEGGGDSFHWMFNRHWRNPQPQFYAAGWYRWRGMKLVPSSREEYEEEAKNWE